MALRIHSIYYGSDVILAENYVCSLTYVNTHGGACIRKDGETPMFDGLGSERTVTNSSQTVTGTITFEAFGATIATTGSSSNPYKFAATSGYRDDGDAGLVRVGARYYDAQVGRFITRDTELDQHPFLYCDHDPVNSLDPSGHNRFTDLLGKAWEAGVGLYEGGKEIAEKLNLVKEVIEWGYDIHNQLVIAGGKAEMRKMYIRWKGNDDGSVIRLLGPDPGDLGGLAEFTGKAAKKMYK